MLSSRSGILAEAISIATSIAFTSLQPRQSISFASFLQYPHLHQSRFPILICNKTVAEAWIYTFLYKNIVYKNIQAQIGQKIKNIVRISSASVLAIVFCFLFFFSKIFLINRNFLFKTVECKSMSLRLCLLTCHLFKLSNLLKLWTFYCFCSMKKLLLACTKCLFNSPRPLFIVLLRILDFLHYSIWKRNLA